MVQIEDVYERKAVPELMAHIERADIRDLKDYASIAADLLSRGTKYQHDKQMIRKVFDWSRDYEDKILLRLAVIDGFYSTHMNRRVHALEELEEALSRIANAKDDSGFSNKAAEFLDSPSDEDTIAVLLSSNFGKRKNRADAGKAPSLISKYIYFLTDFNFPIYDSLARDTYKRITKHYKHPWLPPLPNGCGSPFFIAINALLKTTGIDNYSDLDNLLWLLGKIESGSLSAVVDNEVYQKILDKVGPSSVDLSEDIDRKVAGMLADAYTLASISQLFSDGMMKIIEFNFRVLDADEA